MSVHQSGFVRFEGYELDRARWQLRYGDEVLPLTRKTFDLLLYLIENADRVVTKDELLRALWPEQFIEESNLTQQVFLLRRALARHPSTGKMIETIPGRGYRFAVPVHFEQHTAPHGQDGQTLEDGGGHLGIQASPEEEEVRASSGGSAQSPNRDIHSAGTSVEARTGSDHPTAPDSSPVTSRPLLWTVTTAVVTLLAAYLLIRPKGSAHIAVSAYTQITHDGHAKAIGGTDGNRIYFTRLEKSAIAQVSASGKGEALMQLALQDPWSGAVSPDGSTMLIVSQASGQGPAASLWTLQLVNGTLHRIGNAVSSAWSPDGEMVVYASASGELFLMHPDGSDAHRIASVGGDISFIAWSPDGRTIRFSRDGFLWQISPDGSNLRQLLPGWGKSPTQWSGEWSPTGAYFFVADGQIWVLENRKAVPWKGAPDPVQLTYGPTVWDRPISSRDGKKIFASGRTRRGELVRFDPASAQPAPFLGGVSAEFVAFSKAAHAVAYVSYPDGILWRANPDGSNPTQLTDPTTYPKSICWSPDGSQLAFVDRAADKTSALYLIATNGTGKPHRLIANDGGTETDPSWSPDGRKIVFSTAPNVGASAQSDIRVFDLATGTTTVLPASHGLLAPRWSPDGRAIAAMTLDAKSMRLLELSTGRWSTLNTGAVAFPEWSHDGRWIYFVRWTANPAIVRLRAADGAQEVLANLTGTQYTGAYTLWMGLDPADNPMMLRDAGTDDIYALSLRRE